MITRTYPLVDAEGIEPPLEEPKSSVLPLNYASIPFVPEVGVEPTRPITGHWSLNPA